MYYVRPEDEKFSEVVASGVRRGEVGFFEEVVEEREPSANRGRRFGHGHMYYGT